MYPDQNQYSIDYLNQIATPQKKPGMGNKLFVIVMIVGVLLAAVIGVALLASASGGPTKDLTVLGVRLTNLQTVTNQAQKDIQSGTLQTANSNLSLFLSNTNREIQTPLANNSVDLKKVDKALAAAEATTELQAALTEARLMNQYDTVYASEMNYQLSLILALMNKIDNQTKSQSLKEFIADTKKNLLPIQQQIKDYTQSTTLD